MKNHKIGDKFVIEIDKIFEQDGETLYRVKGMKSLVFDEYGLNILEPLSAYTDLLETKIRRQASHIRYLEGKIKELKSDLKHGRTIEDDCDPEAKRTAGQEEAWELAQKCMLMTDRKREAIFGSGHNALYGVLTYFDYKHAAAKVAEWERKKEEICVGDVVRFKSNNRVEFCVTDILDNSFLYGISAEGDVYSDRDIKLFEKTGRHIDIASMLAQIGGWNNETEN